MFRASSYCDAGILVVGGEPSVVASLSAALEGAGYSNVRRVIDPAGLQVHVDRHPPDLAVIDLDTLGRDAQRLVEQLHRGAPDGTLLPVVVVSDRGESCSRPGAMLAGAHVFLHKPVDDWSLLAHAHSLLEIRLRYQKLSESCVLLEEQVRQRTDEARREYLQVVERLGLIAGLREDSTGQHGRRVARVSALIAQELHLSPEETELIMRASPLHDLGNIGVDERIFRKIGGLTEDERASIREHTTLGAKLLHGVDSELLQMAESIALSHHERWDGRGYPQGLAGESIPLAARIVCVADSFDALTHARPYRDAVSVSEAVAEIERESGWQFDPQIVDALVRIQRRETDRQTSASGSWASSSLYAALGNG